MIYVLENILSSDVELGEGNQIEIISGDEDCNFLQNIVDLLRN